MKKIFIILILNLFAFNLICQNIDSLNSLFSNQKEDSLKINTLKEIIYYYILKSDTTNYDIKIQLYENILDENDDLNNIDNNNFLIGIFQSINNFEKTVFYYEKTARISLDENNLQVYCYLKNYLSYYYTEYGFYDKSIEISLNLLQFIEENKLEEELEFTYLILAYAYRDYSMYDKALDYFMKSAEFSDSLNPQNYLHVAYNEIGNIYNLKENYTKALEYQLKALKIRQQLNSKVYLAYSFNDIAYTYYQMNDFEKS